MSMQRRERAGVGVPSAVQPGEAAASGAWHTRRRPLAVVVLPNPRHASGIGVAPVPINLPL